MVLGDHLTSQLYPSRGKEESSSTIKHAQKFKGIQMRQKQSKVKRLIVTGSQTQDTWLEPCWVAQARGVLGQLPRAGGCLVAIVQSLMSAGFPKNKHALCVVFSNLTGPRFYTHNVVYTVNKLAYRKHHLQLPVVYGTEPTTFCQYMYLLPQKQGNKGEVESAYIIHMVIVWCLSTDQSMAIIISTCNTDKVASYNDRTVG